MANELSTKERLDLRKNDMSPALIKVTDEIQELQNQSASSGLSCWYQACVKLKEVAVNRDKFEQDDLVKLTKYLGYSRRKLNYQLSVADRFSEKEIAEYQKVKNQIGEAVSKSVIIAISHVPKQTERRKLITQLWRKNSFSTMAFAQAVSEQTQPVSESGDDNGSGQGAELILHKEAKKATGMIGKVIARVQNLLAVDLDIGMDKKTAANVEELRLKAIALKDTMDALLAKLPRESDIIDAIPAESAEVASDSPEEDDKPVSAADIARQALGGLSPEQQALVSARTASNGKAAPVKKKRGRPKKNPEAAGACEVPAKKRAVRKKKKKGSTKGPGRHRRRGRQEPVAAG